MAIATEMLDLAKVANATELLTRRTLSGVHIACSSWEMCAAADAEIDAYGRMAGREPANLSSLPRQRDVRAMRALMQGRFEDSERLAQQAFAIGQRLQTETAAGVFGLQMFALRREQGRLKEVEPRRSGLCPAEFRRCRLAPRPGGNLLRARTDVGRARGIREPGAARLRRPAPRRAVDGNHDLSRGRLHLSGGPGPR